MENTKITIADKFDMVIEVLVANGRDDLVEFIEDRKAKHISRMSKGSDKPTKTQKENEKIMETIVSALESIGSGTVTDLMKCDGLTEFSNQKLSALLRKLVESGKVVKTIDKKKSIFSLAD